MANISTSKTFFLLFYNNEISDQIWIDFSAEIDWNLPVVAAKNPLQSTICYHWMGTQNSLKSPYLERVIILCILKHVTIKYQIVEVNTAKGLILVIFLFLSNKK